MKTLASIAAMALLILGVALLLWQRRELAGLRAHLETRRSHIAPAVTEPAPPPLDSNRPSSELLRLRAEATALRAELARARASTSAPAASAEKLRAVEDDWALVHSGPKPSSFPDYRTFGSMANAGFATPEAAFESFQFFMRHRDEFLMDDHQRTKLLWDVPDDFGDPNGDCCNIHLGEGIGGELGYRIVRRETPAPGVARLVLDFEHADGTSDRHERIFVERNGSWRLKPVSISRAAKTGDTPSNPPGHTAP